jgi:hypothetical protein
VEGICVSIVGTREEEVFEALGPEVVGAVGHPAGAYSQVEVVRRAISR